MNNATILIQDDIYSACKKNIRKERNDQPLDKYDNRTSKHFKAITEMNFKMYKYSLEMNYPSHQIDFYAGQWGRVKFVKLKRIFVTH